MSILGLREFHPFEAAGRRYVYLVPSAAVFALDDCSEAVLKELDAGPRAAADLAQDLGARFDRAEVSDTIAELQRVRLLGEVDKPSAFAPGASADKKGLSPPATPKIVPLRPVPLQTLVVNVTNQCNLACTYCYEYGEDKIVDTENGQQPKFMSEETARESVEFALRESRENRHAHITFFGGETLMNFPVLKSTIAYARRRAAEVGKDIDFSLTTNATLLQPDVIEFLASERVGVTISIDGPEDMQDKFRVFNNGQGSYAMAAPKIKALLARHRSRPVGARVTLTKQTLDVRRIYKHLSEDLGFWEVGFAPVTTAPGRDYAISDGGFDHLLEQFRALATEYLEASLQNRHHGFSNVRETLQEIHQGHAKAYPCGAGIGLMGVSTDGRVALCHRFAGSDDHGLGTVRDGVSWPKQQAFLDAHHVSNKTDCATCWARPICAGGCYHEANTRYGSTERPNLHYCEWIRGWTHTCLEIYGELAARNPGFLRQFDDQPTERVS
ncbi:MAG: quinohemoprotein amine dehydrogenase maturation protein [Acidobacteria bacterium RIFCSPLOWO2_12_FULL_67_14b]|nr:MAG: quinohemoprotein amine dehydrogenase maturation protein [Acidobacteria bacterium RIFCSPLOWO2_12_FULL_67_14b]